MCPGANAQARPGRRPSTRATAGHARASAASASASSRCPLGPYSGTPERSPLDRRRDRPPTRARPPSTTAPARNPRFPDLKDRHRSTVASSTSATSTASPPITTWHYAQAASAIAARARSPSRSPARRSSAVSSARACRSRTTSARSGVPPAARSAPLSEPPPTSPTSHVPRVRRPVHRPHPRSDDLPREPPADDPQRPENRSASLIES